MPRSTFAQKISMYAIFIAAVFVLILNAWISDDAMITFRTVMNFINGYGPVFNVGERVQAYTHPLWFLLLTFGTILFHNVYYISISLGILCTLLLLWFLIHHSVANSMASTAIFILLLSKAFVEYSTSGLENPLSHIMIIVGLYFFLDFMRDKKNKSALLGLTMLVSSYLSRPDLIFITFPPAFFILKNIPFFKTRVQFLMLSCAPAFMWTMFSIIYYGFPFPNTAYAKLNNGIPRVDLFHQGARYFADSLVRDPISLVVIFSAIIVSCCINKKMEMKIIILGLLFYMFYILSIGGDFMSGRFFTVPLVVSTFIFTQIQLPKHFRNSLLALFAILGLFSLRSTFLSPIAHHGEHILDTNGIADEKYYWFGNFSLLSPTHMAFETPSEWIQKNNYIHRTCGSLGQMGMAYGPNTFIIDLCGLADPLLARIPPFHNTHWRIGHFYRRMPTNYEFLLQYGDESKIVDEPTLEYWRYLKILTRDPIFSMKRMKTIWEMNTSGVPKPDFRMYQFEDVPSQALPISMFKNDEVPDEKQNFNFYPFVYGIELFFEKPTTIRSFDFSLFGSTDCTVKARSKNTEKIVGDFTLIPEKINQFQLSLRSPMNDVQSIKIVLKSNNHPLPTSKLGHFRVNTL